MHFQVSHSSQTILVLPTSVLTHRNNRIEITNSTWKSLTVAEGVSKFSKLWPAYINDNKEMDTFIYGHNKNISWINNIRGASAILKLHQITKEKCVGALVTDFDKDTVDDVLCLTQDRK